MKYLVTIPITIRYILEVSAKDEEKAIEKASAAFDKIAEKGHPVIDESQIGNFELETDYEDLNCEEAD